MKFWNKTLFKRHKRKKTFPSQLFQVNPLYRNIFSDICGVWSSYRAIYISYEWCWWTLKHYKKVHFWNARPFLINTRVFRYVVVELFMSDVDGYAETVVSLACASKTIQCWRNVHHHSVNFDTASTFTPSSWSMHTLALPIQNAFMDVVQVELFTSYYSVQKFLRDHMGGWVERGKEGCHPTEV